MRAPVHCAAARDVGGSGAPAVRAAHRALRPGRALRRDRGVRGGAAAAPHPRLFLEDRRRPRPHARGTRRAPRRESGERAAGRHRQPEAHRPRAGLRDVGRRQRREIGRGEGAAPRVGRARRSRAHKGARSPLLARSGATRAIPSPSPPALGAHHVRPASPRLLPSFRTTAHPTLHTCPTLTLPHPTAPLPSASARWAL